MRILIANRGEIACRIARTCHRMGAATVGVYSEADRAARHVDLVDVAIALGGVAPADSYLRVDAILDAARRTGATAIHPGYGFLAENAEFAQAVIDAGLRWIGPTPEQIRLLGDKVAAKRAAIRAGIPTADVVEVRPGEVPTDVPMPALVKAAAGGGGRGMRVVRDVTELPDALAGAAREAEAAFGDGTVFIEPFVEHGRHVEVQILADTHGNVVHLGDRDCSVQRRNQKIIEEAPAPGLDERTRLALHDGAVSLARHVGYMGVGTVEFMVGAAGSTPTAPDASPSITFLEVNTRLQVEHPVTEAVTGIDLVEMQIAVAHGAPLPWTQDDLRMTGHAVEARLVAEDPAAGWLPSTGRLDEFAIDDLDGELRIDTGYRRDDIVPADYDSLLAKVIAHDTDRAGAIRRLERAMRTARISGVRTNARMLAATMAEADFTGGGVTTAYLAEHPEVSSAPAPAGDDLVMLVIAATLVGEAAHRAADRRTGFAPSGWRNLRTRGQRRSWIVEPAAGNHDDHLVQVEYVVRDGDIEVLLGPWPEPDPETGQLPDDTRRRLDVVVLARDGDRIALEVDGRRQRLMVQECAGDAVLASGPEGAVTLARPARWVDHDDRATGGGPICPLPGTVIAVEVAPGQRVVAGDVLMVIEAMKMEHRITAVSDAVVTDVHFAVGDRVDAGDLLVALGDASEQPSADEDRRDG